MTERSGLPLNEHMAVPQLAAALQLAVIGHCPFWRVDEVARVAQTAEAPAAFEALPAPRGSAV